MKSAQVNAIQARLATENLTLAQKIELFQQIDELIAAIRKSEISASKDASAAESTGFKGVAMIAGGLAIAGIPFIGLPILIIAMVLGIGKVSEAAGKRGVVARIHAMNQPDIDMYESLKRQILHAPAPAKEQASVTAAAVPARNRDRRPERDTALSGSMARDAASPDSTRRPEGKGGRRRGDREHVTFRDSHASNAYYGMQPSAGTPSRHQPGQFPSELHGATPWRQPGGYGQPPYAGSYPQSAGGQPFVEWQRGYQPPLSDTDFAVIQSQRLDLMRKQLIVMRAARDAAATSPAERFQAEMDALGREMAALQTELLRRREPARDVGSPAPHREGLSDPATPAAPSALHSGFDRRTPAGSVHAATSPVTRDERGTTPLSDGEASPLRLLSPRDRFPASGGGFDAESDDGRGTPRRRPADTNPEWQAGIAASMQRIMAGLANLEQRMAQAGIQVPTRPPAAPQPDWQRRQDPAALATVTPTSPSARTRGMGGRSPGTNASDLDGYSADEQDGDSRRRNMRPSAFRGGMAQHQPRRGTYNRGTHDDGMAEVVEAEDYLNGLQQRGAERDAHLSRVRDAAVRRDQMAGLEAEIAANRRRIEALEGRDMDQEGAHNLTRRVAGALGRNTVGVPGRHLPTRVMPVVSDDDTARPSPTNVGGTGRRKAVPASAQVSGEDLAVARQEIERLNRELAAVRNTQAAAMGGEAVHALRADIRALQAELDTNRRRTEEDVLQHRHQLRQMEAGGIDAARDAEESARRFVLERERANREAESLKEALRVAHAERIRAQEAAAADREVLRQQYDALERRADLDRAAAIGRYQAFSAEQLAGDEDRLRQGLALTQRLRELEAENEELQAQLARRVRTQPVMGDRGLSISPLTSDNDSEVGPSGRSRGSRRRGSAPRGSDANDAQRQLADLRRQLAANEYAMAQIDAALNPDATQPGAARGLVAGGQGTQTPPNADELLRRVREIQQVAAQNAATQRTLGEREDAHKRELATRDAALEEERVAARRAAVERDAEHKRAIEEAQRRATAAEEAVEAQKRLAAVQPPQTAVGGKTPAQLQAELQTAQTDLARVRQEVEAEKKRADVISRDQEVLRQRQADAFEAERATHRDTQAELDAFKRAQEERPMPVTLEAYKESDRGAAQGGDATEVAALRARIAELERLASINATSASGEEPPHAVVPRAIVLDDDDGIPPPPTVGDLQKIIAGLRNQIDAATKAAIEGRMGRNPAESGADDDLELPPLLGSVQALSNALTANKAELARLQAEFDQQRRLMEEATRKVPEMKLEQEVADARARLAADERAAEDAQRQRNLKELQQENAANVAARTKAEAELDTARKALEALLAPKGIGVSVDDDFADLIPTQVATAKSLLGTIKQLEEQLRRVELSAASAKHEREEVAKAQRNAQLQAELERTHILAAQETEMAARDAVLRKLRAENAELQRQIAAADAIRRKVVVDASTQAPEASTTPPPPPPPPHPTPVPALPKKASFKTFAVYSRHGATIVGVYTFADAANAYMLHEGIQVDDSDASRAKIEDAIPLSFIRPAGRSEGDAKFFTDTWKNAAAERLAQQFAEAAKFYLIRNNISLPTAGGRINLTLEQLGEISAEMKSFYGKHGADTKPAIPFMPKDMNAYIATAEGQNWLNRQEGAYWLLETARGKEFFGGKVRAGWLDSPEGNTWLQGVGGSAFIAKAEGQAWLSDKVQRGWLSSPEGLGWLGSPTGKGWLDGSERQQAWVKTDRNEGYSWLAKPEGSAWLASGRSSWLGAARDGTSLEGAEAKNWLRSDAGKRWLSTLEYGYRWLGTEQGTAWLGTHQGKDWVKAEGKAWKESEAGKAWLKQKASKAATPASTPRGERIDPGSHAVQKGANTTPGADLLVGFEAADTDFPSADRRDPAATRGGQQQHRITAAADDLEEFFQPAAAATVTPQQSFLIGVLARLPIGIAAPGTPERLQQEAAILQSCAGVDPTVLTLKRDEMVVSYIEVLKNVASTHPGEIPATALLAVSNEVSAHYREDHLLFTMDTRAAGAKAGAAYVSDSTRGRPLETQLGRLTGLFAASVTHRREVSGSGFELL